MTRKNSKAIKLWIKQVNKKVDRVHNPGNAFYKELKGERASNNWRRLHGMKPLRRVTE